MTNAARGWDGADLESDVTVLYAQFTGVEEFKDSLFLADVVRRMASSSEAY